MSNLSKYGLSQKVLQLLFYCKDLVMQYFWGCLEAYTTLCSRTDATKRLRWGFTSICYYILNCVLVIITSHFVEISPNIEWPYLLLCIQRLNIHEKLLQSPSGSANPGHCWLTCILLLFSPHPAWICFQWIYAECREMRPQCLSIKNRACVNWAYVAASDYAKSAAGKLCN